MQEHMSIYGGGGMCAEIGCRFVAQGGFELVKLLSQPLCGALRQELLPGCYFLTVTNSIL